MEYLTAKQVIGRLRQGRVADISEAYFSQRVRDGYIPFHKLPAKRRKLYVYDEVKQAFIGAQDPSRDAQREANLQKKIDEKLMNDLIKEEEERQKEVLVLDKIFKAANYADDFIRNLSQGEHLQLLADKGVKDVDAAYEDDRDIFIDNVTILDLIHEYLEIIREEEKPIHPNKLDFIIKKLLVNALQDDYYIDIKA